jgi:hypothetical protein
MLFFENIFSFFSYESFYCFTTKVHIKFALVLVLFGFTSFVKMYFSPIAHIIYLHLVFNYLKFLYTFLKRDSWGNLQFYACFIHLVVLHLCPSYAYFGWNVTWNETSSIYRRECYYFSCPFFWGSVR